MRSAASMWKLVQSAMVTELKAELSSCAPPLLGYHPQEAKTAADALEALPFSSRLIGKTMTDAVVRKRAGQLEHFLKELCRFHEAFVLPNEAMLLLASFLKVIEVVQGRWHIFEMGNQPSDASMGGL